MKIEPNNIYLGDCLEVMKDIPDESIDIVITSPPYNVGIEYNSNDDNLEYEKYLEWIKNVFETIYCKLKNGGRICVNVAMESNKGGKKYLANDINNVFEKIGYIRNSTIIWDKQNLSKRTAWGSWKSPSCPNIINPLEVIIVCSKGSRKKEGSKENIDVSRDEFIEYSLGVWKFGSESAKRVNHPAPYPKELPYRCLKMFSYINDTVLDPFMGSGTTGVVCKLLNRNFIGIEISKEYFEIAKKRIESVTAVQTALEV